MHNHVSRWLDSPYEPVCLAFNLPRPRGTARATVKRIQEERRGAAEARVRQMQP